MTSPVTIGDRQIGCGKPCYVIAEAGVNHDGELEAARELVHAARDAGADAVKFQLFRSDDLASLEAPKAPYQLEATNPNESQTRMLERLELPPEAFVDLARECERIGIDFLCTAYSETGLDVLDDIGVKAFKLASAQIVEHSLIAYAARKGRPLLVSTGMATLDEIDDALSVIHTAADVPVVLLQCTTDYPSAIKDTNLRAMATLEARYGLPVGFSDHTLGEVAAVAAVARGALVLEKHLTLDTRRPGPDHAASMEPAALTRLIATIREVELALGSREKQPTERELANSFAMRRSVAAIRNIEAGAVLDNANVGLRRPARGLPPSALPDVLGATAAVDIPAGTPITLDLLAR